ncbi:MAG: cytochrome c biogenesis protein CcdA [Chloroflexota bacterium]
MEQVSILIAFAAGVVSFISPCVLPLIPAYITTLSGATLAPGNPLPRRVVVLTHALAFVFGFSLVFILIWTSLGLLGYVARDYLTYARFAGGIVLVFMGLHVMGIWHIPFLEREVRPGFPTAGRASYPRSFVTGVIFATGWTPCIGPILGAIIGLASLRESVWQGTYLLAAYSLGLAIPFLATAAAMNPLFRLLQRSQRHLKTISIISGSLVILIGFLMLTNTFTFLSTYFSWVII